MISVSFTIYRPGPTPDDPEVEIPGEVSGTINGAERDVGIMSSWAEDICFTSDEGLAYALTEKEEAKAEEALCEADRYDYDD